MSLITSPKKTDKSIEKRQSVMKCVTITLLFLTFVNLFAFSQQQRQSQPQTSIRDFFIPSELKELAKSDYKGTINMSVYYSYKGNKQYEVMYEYKVQNQVTSRSLTNLEISSNEVMLLKVITESALHEGRTLKFERPITILRLPIGNQPISWESRSLSDEIQNCTAILTKTVYNGKEYETIKVTKKSIESVILENNYYLKGIGLYKTVYFNPKTKEEVVAYQLTQVQGK